MGISFSPDQWDRVKSAYGAWWENSLDRPILPVTLGNRDPGRLQPKAPILAQATCADLTIPAEDLIDRLDYELSKITYLGDAYPLISFDSFGPGLAAAFLGARLDNSTGRVWFHPEKLVPVSELHATYDPDNVWLQRIRKIYRAGLERWQGQVLMSLPDLGGSLDVVSTFRPAENLLFDLVDEPEEVKRVNWECHTLWHRFFRELSDELRLPAPADPLRSKDTHLSGNPIAHLSGAPAANPGWSDWSGTYSSLPAYILQCDFCYMISPAMFDEFVKPELAASAKQLGQAIYHLDGIGQLPHLDSLLQIPEIRAIQWVPGDGKPPQDEWPEVWKKISQAGKGSLVYCGLDGLERITRAIGTTKGICHMPMQVEPAQEAAIRERLAKYF